MQKLYVHIPQLVALCYAMCIGRADFADILMLITSPFQIKNYLKCV